MVKDTKGKTPIKKYVKKEKKISIVLDQPLHQYTEQEEHDSPTLIEMLTLPTSSLPSASDSQSLSVLFPKQTRKGKEKDIEQMKEGKLILVNDPETMKVKTLTGDVKQNWVQFMKIVKSWSHTKNIDTKNIYDFSRYYYKILTNSDRKQETLDTMMELFRRNMADKETLKDIIPIQVVPYEEQETANPESSEPKIEDIMDEDETQTVEQPPPPAVYSSNVLSPLQLKHIEEVVKIMQKEPKLKADIKRTITEELTKGYIKHDEFKKYNEEIEKLNITQDTPQTIRGKRTIKKPRAKKSKQVDIPIVPMEMDTLSKIPKGKSVKDNQKKKPKIVTL